ncbi:GAF domain-containing protein [bacterium CPR1]|nr:GAF domain-containing protein [bacterium CPR1]
MASEDDRLEREHLELLLRAGELLGSSLSIQEILDRLMDQVILALGAERGFVVLKGQVRCARALDPAALDGEDFRISRSVVEQVIREGISVLTSDAHHDRALGSYTSVSLHEMKSILCVPLLLRGEAFGVVYADHRMQTGIFDGRDRRLLEAIARQAAIALENAMLHEESLQRAQQELVQAQAQLHHSRKLAAVGQLAAGVAHELNTPLGTIALNVSALLPGASESLSKRLTLMDRAVDRCRTIVQRLLTFARPVRSEARPVDIERLVAETLALAEPEFSGQEITVEVQVTPGLSAQADPLELSQVLLNLLLNARDALSELAPGKPRRLAVRAAQDGHHVLLGVHDNGPGVDPGLQERIFEPFFTTKQVGRGIGLGLSLSHEMVESMGGTLRLRSEPGKGASFLIRLARG